MHSSGRGIVAVLLLTFAVWRLVRFMKFGSRLHRASSPVSAHWPHGVLDPSTTAGAEPPPSDLKSTTVRFAASAAAVIVWAVGNLVLYFALFQLPFERDLPFIWPLFLLIFANFYLIPFAGRSGRRWAQRFEPDSSVIG